MTERRFFNTERAAKYLGFETAAGIRQCVYRGELDPDGRGYRGGYVFTTETLDAFVKRRLERLGGSPSTSANISSRDDESTRAPRSRRRRLPRRRASISSAEPRVRLREIIERASKG